MNQSVRQFLCTATAAVISVPATLVLAGCASTRSNAPQATVSPIASAPVEVDAGPVLGSVTQTGARVWVHVADIAKQPGGRTMLTLLVDDPQATDRRGFEAEATVDSGGSAMFRLEGLRPGVETAYRVVSARDGVRLAGGRVRTLPLRVPQSRFAFGASAETDDSTARAWRAIESEHPDALVLLGDAPSIGSTSLATQRERHLAFAQFPAFASLVATTPLYSVWDDRDFGAGKADEPTAGKSNSRRAFMECRPNPSFGEAASGMFTSFRHGEVEVFLLDTRWFAGTEPSKQDPTKKTLLGEQQWRWLENGLSRSKAAFKVVACGMSWNGLVEAGKSEPWAAYPHEFTRFVRLVASTRASGVVLVSGDSRRSRVVRHATAAVAGYDLMEFVTGPLDARTGAETPLRSPATEEGAIACEAVFDKAAPNAFLLLDLDASTVERAALVATFIDADGTRLHTMELSGASLGRRSAPSRPASP